MRVADRYQALLLFLVLALALLVAGWPAIHAAHHEVGDFAANSLLIQDAKQLRLVYGNYSRIGFNHPGPAILYVLAAGELLLHDWLRWLPSPFSGQLAAVCIYNAAWLALIFAMLRRLAGSAAALLGIGVAVLVLAGADYRILTGIWFPHLYVLPYLALLIALSRLVYGHTDMLRALALSAGFLVNGHVSFIVTLAIALALVLAANWLLTRQMPSQRVLAPAYLRRHRRALLVACGILLLFFVPLLMATVRDFPGPLWDYLKFGRAGKGNTLAQALAYLAAYWGSGVAMGWGMLLLVLLAVGLRGVAAPFMRDVRALAVTLLAASMAVLFYAKRGVDQLDQPYICLFYYAVPALALVLVALCLYQAAQQPRKAVAAWGLGLAALAGAWPWLSKPADYNCNFDRTGLVALYQQLHALPGQGRIVLDLDNSADWGDIWGGVLGVQAYARRQGVDLFCVHENWHISNTRAAACRPEELSTARRYRVYQTGAPRLALGDADMEQMGLMLYRAVAHAPSAPYVTVQQQPQYFRRVLGSGWAGVDGEFVWSVGAVAHIELPADARRGDEVMLDLGSFMPDIQFHQPVQVWRDGRLVAQLELHGYARRRQVRVALGADGSAAQHLELRIGRPTSPQELGLSDDGRKLGVSLYGIRIKEKT